MIEAETERAHAARELHQPGTHCQALSSGECSNRSFSPRG